MLNLPGLEIVGPSRQRARSFTRLLLLALVIAPALTPTAGPSAIAGEETGAAAARIVASRTESTVAGAAAAAAAAAARGPAATISTQSLSPVADTTLSDPVLAAKQAIAACQARFAQVDDYTCLFLKRERLDGTLGPQHVMQMKARTRPNSVYFKFQKPTKGREAIYVAGRHNGRVLAHDVGLFKVLAGTWLLDPKGEVAMDGCRHPITEAGLGALIDTVATHWERELSPDESRVLFDAHLKIGKKPCTMIESVHPQRRSDFLFHKVRLFIDHETGLPVRFEAYDWPVNPGDPDVLVEEYVYVNLELNVGLTDRDFDPNNRSYSFGRF